MEKEVVSSVAGQVVKFHTHAGLGGIADTLGKWKEEAEKSPAVELTTTTLGEVLERAKAPSFIHFLSLDIEGAELEALAACRSTSIASARWPSSTTTKNRSGPTC